MAAQGIDYYIIDEPYTIVVLFREDLCRVTFVVLNPLMVFAVDVPVPKDDAEVGEGAVLADSKDGDLELVADNEQ